MLATRVGYTGGPRTSRSVTYDSVCDDDGHTEAVRVTFDPSVLSYDALLREFWDISASRATTTRRKAQYKSAIWTTNDAQAAHVAIAMREKAEELGMEIVTEVRALDAWHDAEERHQKYVEKNRGCSLHGSLPCTPWSSWQRLNYKKADEKGKMKIDKMREDSMVMLGNFCKVARAVQKHGKVFRMACLL